MSKIIQGDVELIQTNYERSQNLKILKREGVSQNIRGLMPMEMCNKIKVNCNFYTGRYAYN